MKEEQYWKAGDFSQREQKAGTIPNKQNKRSRGFIQELIITGWIKAGGVVKRVNSEVYDPKFSREKVLYLYLFLFTLYTGIMGKFCRDN